jgi:SP family facilitated glucose transporter-like MFS transporter 8
MEGENSSIEKGLLLIRKEESANTTPFLVFTTFIIVSASFSFGVAVRFHLSLSLSLDTHTYDTRFEI